MARARGRLGVAPAAPALLRAAGRGARRRGNRRDGFPVRAHGAGWRGRRGRHRRVPRGRGRPLYRAVGYFGSPLDGIPFDEKRGVIPNREGQVIDDDDEVIPGVYATGWIKRGPVGLIGHTKSDAMETISHLVVDQANWWSPARPVAGGDRRAARVARRRVHRPRRLAPARRARDRARRAAGPRAHQGRRATRWSRSPAASSRCLRRRSQRCRDARTVDYSTRSRLAVALLHRRRQPRHVVERARQHAAAAATPRGSARGCCVAVVVLDRAQPLRGRCRPSTITEISRSRLNERMSMLLEPITETSSSMVKCLACRIVGAL